jgi:hypothetical protein
MIHFKSYIDPKVAPRFGMEVVTRSRWKQGYINEDMVFFHSTNFCINRDIPTSVLDPRYAKEYVIDSEGNQIGKLIWAFPKGSENGAAKGFGTNTRYRYYFRVPAGTEFYATEPIADKGAPAGTEVGFPYIIEQEDIIWEK